MSVGIFTGLLQYCPRKSDILVQKLEKEKNLSKSVSGYFMMKKKKRKYPTCHYKPEGEGEGLNGPVIKKRTFTFAAAINNKKQMYNMFHENGSLSVYSLNEYYLYLYHSYRGSSVNLTQETHCTLFIISSA